MRGERAVDGPPVGENAEQVDSIGMVNPVVGMSINGVFEEQPKHDDTGQRVPAESVAVEGELEQTPLVPGNQGTQVLEGTRVELQTHVEQYLKANKQKAETGIDKSTGSSTLSNVNNYRHATSRIHIDHHEDSKGIISSEKSRHLETINQGSNHKETNQLFSLDTAERMQRPPPLNQPVGQPNGLMPTLEVTKAGIASTWSLEQLQSYSPEIVVQLMLPQQIAMRWEDHSLEYHLNLDENGYYKLSATDVNHPVIAALMDSRLNQKSPGAQSPLVASLINSPTDSNPSREPRHSGPPGC